VIRIVKPAAPAALAPGAQLTTADCAAFDLEPAAYRSGAKNFKFQKNVYGPTSVKNALKGAQHHKCCYCEARFDATHAGDVEHYRPKGAVSGAAGKVLPGYYWLAYAWSNLFYACAACNQYAKRSQFPLADEAKRAADHHHNLADEVPLILDPGGVEDPRAHIVFRGDVATWTSPQGKATVKALKLDRDGLNLARRSHPESLDRLLRTISALEQSADTEAVTLVAEARALLHAAALADAVFSAASQDFLSNIP
jgi:uncharacterized protein (TIGR02646 family)